MVNNNQPAIVLNRWKTPGDRTAIAKFTQDRIGDAYQSMLNLRYYGGNNRFDDASFLRLKYISLSSNIPLPWLFNLTLHHSPAFLPGQNIVRPSCLDNFCLFVSSFLFI